MLINNLLCVIIVLKLNVSSTVIDYKKPSPIILVPGAAGSRAYSFIGCNNFKKASLVWLDLRLMLFPSVLTEVFKLNYNPATHKTSDANCSKVFFPGWGSTKMIEYLDNNPLVKTVYFGTLVKCLMEDKFYIRNKTIRGTPYDFRKAPNENEDFVPDMKKLIEDTYQLTNNQKVVILGHSMGSMYSLFFLKRMSISWKRKYIKSFISVSAPLGGAVKALVMETTGSNMGSKVRSHQLFRELQRSFPSTAFNLPLPGSFGNQSIIITSKRNYSAYEYKELFKDLNMTYESMMYDDTKDLVNGDETPEGIDELHCIHSYGMPTTKQIIFKSLEDKKPVEINGDGDGTVNINSLEICKKWNRVQYYTIKDVNHRKILANPKFISYLKHILYRKSILNPI